MNYTLEPSKITKDLILSKIREETLMEHYLGIPVKKGLHKSPLRTDSTPTCAFYRNAKGDLIFKDFRGDFSGNFISVVMYKFNCSFYKALQIIANDFGIVSRKDIKVNKSKIKEYTNVEFKETKAAVIQIECKEYDKHELNYWGRYGITESTLKKFKVYSCKNVWLNNNLFHLQKTKQLVFGYYGGHKDELEQWRIYFPGRKKFKFISNWRKTQLQGARQLPKEGGEFLVITKSLKDVMTLYECGVPSVAPISENLFITDSQYERISKAFKNIILFYDNDLAGISNMNKIRKQYPVHVVFIPREFNVKDISDFYEKYGREKTLDLINQAKVHINGKKEKEIIEVQSN